MNNNVFQFPRFSLSSLFYELLILEMALSLEFFFLQKNGIFLIMALVTWFFDMMCSTNAVCHLCLSLEKPLLDELEIQNLILRIPSEKPTKHPLSSLKFCSHCRSSQKYPLPAADSCFMDPEMELHQQSWSKKTSSRSSWLVSFVLSFGAAVHRLSGAPAITVGKLFHTVKVGLRSPKLSSSKMSNTHWKETPFWVIGGKCLCQRQCYTQDIIDLVSQEHLPEPCGCIGQRYRYIKLALAFLPIIYVSAGWGHCFLFVYLFRCFVILSVVHCLDSFSILVQIHELF